jgi:ferrochelatase
VTEEQAALLERRVRVPVLVGMRLAEPTIEEGLLRAAERGLERVVVVPLAPFSVHVYLAAAKAAREKIIAGGGKAPELVAVGAWGESSHFIRAHAAAIRPYLTPDARLLLTAHSLPLVAIRGGDPYEAQVRASAAAVGRELDRPFELAFQSQGADGGEWLGPTLSSALETAKRDGAGHIVLAPFGFLSEHVETLYDLDVEARGWATALDLKWTRVPALGVAEGLIEALADLVIRALS